jgi:hypothetical protein
MLRMDCYRGVLLAKRCCCVLEDDVAVNDAWHVSMVGVKVSGCMFSPPEVNNYVCLLPKGSSCMYLLDWNKRSIVSDCLMLGSGA